MAADHGQGSFRAGVKVACRNADQSVEATAICGLGETECAKDTGDLLALAFIPRLNMALKRIISHQRDENGKLVSDGTLAVCKKQRGAEGEEQGAKGDVFCATLDRMERLCPIDTLELNAAIRVFITGDLAFHATMLGKEGVDKAHCIWCKLKRSEWQTHGHEPGIKWTLQKFKRVAASLDATRTSENGVKSHPLLDCIELERQCLSSSACDAWTCESASKRHH